MAQRPHLHLVLTGRKAQEACTELADMGLAVTLLTHPYQVGMKAQRGVEF